MIDKSISNLVVTIGSNIEGKGGIAKLLQSYHSIFERFNYIRCTCDGNIWKRTYVYLFSLFNLCKKCASSKCKIVHIHSSSYILLNKTAIYIILVSLFRKKIILHLHGGDIERVCKKHQRFLQWLFSQVNQIICVSSYIKDIIEKYNLSSNVVVLYNIVDKPTIEKSLSRKTNKICFLFLGKVCEEKGIYDVIDVINEHKDYFRDKAVLNIAGWEDVEMLEKNILENGTKDIIHYLGWANNQMKTLYLNKSDVYIQPTYFESLGIAILEAMSYNLPVISTNVGGVPEIVHNNINGFLINPKDKKMIFEKMKYLIENPDKRILMGIEGSKIVKNFYAEEIEKKLIKLYTDLL